MRSELRFLSEALVHVDDKSGDGAKGNLCNLSEYGLSLESDNYISMEPNSSCVITVIPEKETQMGKFRLEVESKWVRLHKRKMAFGFSILGSPDEKEFKEYLAYLAQKDKEDSPPEDTGRSETET